MLSPRFKRHIIGGSDPKICLLCEQKSVTWVFEARKEYPMKTTKSSKLENLTTKHERDFCCDRIGELAFS